ncbi:hypothetical protein H5410_048516 [Solanum commersonii]|uniref:Uncharacterized protein n=1 Tax=Solanum commersonii TaxID=4109 RepID=A0A9J5XK21_SOLCO|nr:hypothetical protein H5410_048516 [Solanum commersonii]
MVAEPWCLRMGSQVSTNVKKHSLLIENSKKLSMKKQTQQEKLFIGILSFEVANMMSKIIHLHKSLTDSEILKLKNEIFKSVGIKALVSDDEDKLLELVLVEKLDDLNRVASVVSRLGKKCTISALQGFQHVYGDVISGVIDVKDLGFLVKDMEGMVRKMERYVNSTASLYCEMAVLNELEVATKKFQQNQHEESRKAFEQKLAWQKQDVRHLEDVSLWNQTYDKVVELLARTVCTVYSRISTVFGNNVLVKRDLLGNRGFNEKSGVIVADSKSEVMDADFKKPVLRNNNGSYRSGSTERGASGKRSMSHSTQTKVGRNEGSLFGTENFNFACGMGPGRLFMECLSLSSASKMDFDNDVGTDDRSSQISGCCSVSSGMKREQSSVSGSFNRSPGSIRFSGDTRQLKSCVANAAKHGPKSRITLYAPPATVGGSALALHYANVIIVVEKLLQYPHLVGDEGRDDLYQMLPTSLRKTLKASLRSYMKGLAIYDAPLAHDWKERLEEILKWLSPLAHNMIRWQSERNFEQQQIVKRTNVLLLQTLYFADCQKMEAVICELLIGLNYICRFEQQQNALLDCASSIDFEDCMEWQLQFGGKVLLMNTNKLVVNQNVRSAIAGPTPDSNYRLLLPASRIFHCRVCIVSTGSPARTVTGGFCNELSEVSQSLRFSVKRIHNLEYFCIVVQLDHRAHRAALFDNYDSIEEGGIRASSSYPRDLDERDNDKAVDSLQDRVSFLKKGNEMDSSRGIMSGIMDQFKMVSHVFHVWMRGRITKIGWPHHKTQHIETCIVSIYFNVMLMTTTVFLTEKC